MPADAVTDYPRVAIVVAARNEEIYVRDLLTSLLAQQYPHGQMEVLLGNDRSTDATGAILEKWAANFPHARVIHITEALPGLVGKANVLAQLCRQTDAPYLLFTDADCILPPTWVSATVAALKMHAGKPHIATAFTVPTYRRPFEAFQAMDWLASQAVIHVLHTLGIPITAVGNNMACTHQAYVAAGGFEATAGSITEDYAIFRRVLAAGGTFSHSVSSNIRVVTRPQPDWKAWLGQRKRWFSGALQLPVWVQLPFWMQLVFYPLLVCVGLASGWKVAAITWVIKVAAQSVLFGSYLIKNGQWRLLAWLLPYDFGIAALSWAMLVSYVVNRRIVWKSISYEAGASGHTPLRE